MTLDLTSKAVSDKDDKEVHFEKVIDQREALSLIVRISKYIEHAVVVLAQ